MPLNSPPFLSTITRTALLTLGQLIKAARLKRRMSQAELAERINTSRQTVIAIEKGRPNVMIGTVLEAAHIVGIPVMAENKQQLSEWQATLANFISILPEKIKQKKIEIDDDF